MMTEQLQRSREWLLFNAVEAWLHHYGNVNTPTLAQYKELQAEFHDAYMQTLHKDAVETTPPPKSPRKRTRNASQSSAKTV
jgi:hypothetical protein